MAADFDAAIKIILAHEGGLCDIPGDHGGITNFGLTIRFLNAEADPQKYVGHPLPWTPDDIRHMTRALASQIYKDCIWDRHGYGKCDDTLVATKIFDMSVNFGEVGGEKIAQRAVNQCGYTPELMVDGNLGSKSYEAINSIERNKLLHAMCDIQSARYKAIVERDPTQEKFLHGWLERSGWPF